MTGLRRVIPSTLFAIAGSTWFHLSTLDEVLVSRRELAGSVALAAALFALAMWSSSGWARTAWKQSASRKSLAISILLAIPLSIPVPGSLSFLQARNLTIEALTNNGPVIIEGINNGHIDIPHAQVVREGPWEYQARTFRADSPATLRWSGHTSSRPYIQFQAGPGMGSVRITWDGLSDEFSLIEEKERQYTYDPHLPLQASIRWLYFFLSLVFFTSLFYLILRWVLSLPPRTAGGRNQAGTWLFYAIPIFLPCLVVLLTYSPALMSGDSLSQWMQAHTLQMEDHHPVFHTLAIRLVTLAWDSPTAVTIAQAAFLSLVAAWGISNLVRRGMPAGIAWLTSLLFAISPVNWLYTATVWKDVPYSISLLWLTLICVEIALSQGRWLTRRKNWAGLVTCCLLVSLFRHNGYPLVILLLPLIILFFRSQWKWTLAALAAVLALRWAVSGPGYRALGASPMPAGLQYALPLHHIGAHVQHGTILSAAERTDIEQLMPLKEWDYSPCSSVPIILGQNLDAGPLLAHPLRYIHLAFNLFLRDPRPDLEAAAGIGSLVYTIQPACNTYVTPLYYKPDTAAGASWIDYTVAGVSGEDSRLPWLVKPLSRFYWQTLSWDSFQLLYILFWRPAAWLAAILFCAVAIAITKRKGRTLLAAAPAILQSLIIFVFNVSQETRYQYGVYLVSLFFTGWLLFSIWEAGPADPEGTTRQRAGQFAGVNDPERMDAPEQPK